MRIEKPVRVRRSWTQHIKAAPDQVFPLLCPVRECDWVQGWRPIQVLTKSGVAERDCVFTTVDKAGAESTWVVTEWDPEGGRIALVKVVPGLTVGQITVRLTPEPTGTAAEVTYMHTALSEEGRRFVESFTETFYARFMKEWEEAMNHYLETGEMRVTD